MLHKIYLNHLEEGNKCYFHSNHADMQKKISYKHAYSKLARTTLAKYFTDVCITVILKAEKDFAHMIVYMKTLHLAHIELPVF